MALEEAPKFVCGFPADPPKLTRQDAAEQKAFAHSVPDKLYVPCKVCGWCEKEIQECRCLSKKGILQSPIQKAWIQAVYNVGKWKELPR